MTRSVAALSLPLFLGMTLLLSELRRVRRVSLASRLEPYAPLTRRRARLGVLSVASFREVAAPLAEAAGSAGARLLGIGDDLDVRLRRIHAPHDAATFRVRQFGQAGLAFGSGVLVAAALRVPLPLAALFTFGAPALTFLLIEQRVSAAAAEWQRRIFLELPIVAEQLGMLMAAGWSLGAALQRLADRGDGACATDLAVVSTRMHQGLTEVDALREWSAVARVEALDRLVGVLALNREAADLDRLITQEARAIRRDAHRELIESIEKRAQQVWIPVTVAALVPGVLLMGIPFVDALALFSG